MNRREALRTLVIGAGAVATGDAFAAQPKSVSGLERWLQIQTPLFPRRRLIGMERTITSRWQLVGYDEIRDCVLHLHPDVDDFVLKRGVIFTGNYIDMNKKTSP